MIRLAASAVCALFIAGSPACSSPDKAKTDSTATAVKPELKPPPASARTLVFAGPITAEVVERAEARLVAAKVSSATVSDDARGLIVVVRSDADAALATRLLTTPGRLELRMVAADTPAMKTIYAEFARRGDGLVLAETEAWRHTDSGKRFNDYYLRSKDRAALVKALSSASAGDGLEFVIGRDDKEWFRSWVVQSAAVITPDHVAGVKAGQDEFGQFVDVVLTDDGKAKFGTTTAARIGDKLTIEIDGVVTSAPIIQTAIPGGRVQIRVGQARGEGLVLAAVLSSGPLPQLTAKTPAKP